MSSVHPGVSCTFYLDEGGSLMSLFLSRGDFEAIGGAATSWPPTGSYTAPYAEGTTIARIVQWFQARVDALDMPHANDFQSVTRVEIAP